MNISRGFGGQEERFNYFKLGSTGWFQPNSCVFNRKGAHLTLGIRRGTRAARACAKTASRRCWIRLDQAGFIISHTWQGQICHIALKPSLFPARCIVWARLRCFEGCRGVSVRQDLIYFPLHTLLSYFHCPTEHTHSHIHRNMHIFAYMHNA